MVGLVEFVHKVEMDVQWMKLSLPPNLAIVGTVNMDEAPMALVARFWTEPLPLSCRI